MSGAMTKPVIEPRNAFEPVPVVEPGSTWHERLYRMSLDEYHRLAESGVLRDCRAELIEGILVTKMTKGQPHIIASELVQAALTQSVPKGWFVSMQNPISLEESGSEPEPDVKVVRGKPRDYKGRGVGPSDVALVVQVSDSTLRDDQVMKKALYAQSAIPVYWIVNLPANRLEVYSDPTGPDYRSQVVLGVEEKVPFVLDGREVARIAINDLLP